jgi:hypothetical protein
VLIKRLDRLATGWNVVATSVVALSLLIAANVFASRFYLQTGGYGLLDLAGGRNALTIQKPYTPEDAYALMAHWGVAGRHDQLIFTLTLDAVVPATTWLFLTLALLYVTRPFATARWRLPFAVLLPAAYLFSDYGENAAVLAMVSNFPSHLDGVAAVGGAAVAYPRRATAAPPRRQRRRSGPPQWTPLRPHPDARTAGSHRSTE